MSDAEQKVLGVKLFWMALIINLPGFLVTSSHPRSAREHSLMNKSKNSTFPLDLFHSSALHPQEEGKVVVPNTSIPSKQRNGKIPLGKNNSEISFIEVNLVRRYKLMGFSVPLARLPPTHCTKYKTNCSLNTNWMCFTWIRETRQKDEVHFTSEV